MSELAVLASQWSLVSDRKVISGVWSDLARLINDIHSPLTVTTLAGWLVLVWVGIFLSICIDKMCPNLFF